MEATFFSRLFANLKRAADVYAEIAELDPGLVTGPLSIIWRAIIEDLVHHFEFDPHQILVAPYDWRLPPSKLQERDQYFYTLMRKSEFICSIFLSF